MTWTKKMCNRGARLALAASKAAESKQKKQNFPIVIMTILMARSKDNLIREAPVAKKIPVPRGLRSPLLGGGGGDDGYDDEAPSRGKVPPVKTRQVALSHPGWRRRRLTTTMKKY